MQVNGKSATTEELAERIGAIVEADNIKNVIIEAHRSVRHQRVVQVVDIARGQGIEAVAFAKSAEGLCMARKLQGNDAKDNELNLTPLIDAVFLLLVFFMVTSVFVHGRLS